MSVAAAVLRTRSLLVVALAFGVSISMGLAWDAASAADNDAVKWLCAPDLDDNPCEIALDTTVLEQSGTSYVVTPDRQPPEERPFDCFYVYPTVSNQLTPNATKATSGEITSIARFQAAPYSSQCRMYAPVYRQVTLAGIPAGLLLKTFDQAYADVLAAWHEYMEDSNDGRGVVLIGHSQGTMMLRRLIHDEIDPNPELREQLIAALLLGGNTLTAKGNTSGGDFQHIPLCTTQGEAGCVVAYSTYAQDPLIAFFGNSSFDVLSSSAGLPTGKAYQVACTDPKALSGIDGPVGVTIPTKPFAYGAIWLGIQYSTYLNTPTAATTWVTSSDRYDGSCKDIRGANVYRYDPIGASRRPPEFPPTWGTHLFDGNLGLERLVSIVSQAGATWLTAQ